MEFTQFEAGPFWLIAEKVKRQRESGWTKEHDDGHRGGELAKAAAVYASPVETYGPSFRRSMGYDLPDVYGHAPLWPFEQDWLKEFYKKRATAVRELDAIELADLRIDDLVNAAALCVVEIERLNRFKNGEVNE